MQFSQSSRRAIPGRATLPLLALALGLFLAVSSCKNEDTPAPVLSITSFTPSSAPVGTPVVITGTAFSATPASNTVTFGGVTAVVTGASTTSLTVVVPANAGTPIAVTSGGATVTSSTAFQLGTKPVVEVMGNITADTRWTVGNVYYLRGFVQVVAPATLTIEAGTIIKGGGKEVDPAGKQQGATLIVLPGAKIVAIGTASAPIVFTSNKAAGSRNYGDWGGIVIMGKAPVNQPGATGFEGGLPGTVGTYSDVNDNSGTLQYVRIEFGGIALLTGSEINGLSLYGVGAGTTLDHIQVSYSGDDSYEWFGGTVNAKNLIAFRGWDDDWDTDWGWSGKVQYGLSLRDPDVADQSGSNGFESDNFNPGLPATSANAGLPLTGGIFANMSNFAFSGTPVNANSSKGSGPYQSGMHLRRNTAISIFNSLIVGYPEGLRLDAPTGTTGTLDNATSGALQLHGVVLANDEIPSSTTAVRGAGSITNAQALAFFTTAAYKNQVIPSTGVAALLLNTASFNLTTPSFLPQTGSPLLTGAIWDGKGADGFFTKETFIGAFGTTDWTKGWTNWDPQNANYDK